MKYPAHLRAAVVQFRADFNVVTGRWVRQGWHSAVEVESWRVEIRRIMESGTDRDIQDVCKCWRGMAVESERGVK